MELSKFVSEVEKHLKKPSGFIAVTQGKNKLTKPNVNKNKYNFTLQDVLAMAPDVETFIKQLPQHGFTDGAIMIFRLKRGGSTHLLSETILKFGSQQLSAPVIQPEQTASPTNPTPTMQHTPITPPVPSAPQAAMGYTQVPSHEWINLKVKEERHADLIERLNKAERDRDKAESELRMEKEKTFGLERKLETIGDRHELAMERLEKDRKGFLETDSGREVIGLAGSLLPKLIDSLDNKQHQIGAGGMANPLSSASPAKQTFVQELVSYPDEVVPILQQVAYHAMNTDGFHEALVNQLSTMTAE